MYRFRIPRTNQHWVYFYHSNLKVKGRVIWPSPGSFRVKQLKKMGFFKAETFINHKILNFNYFYAYALAYKEFLKLATLIKKHVQTV